MRQSIAQIEDPPFMEGRQEAASSLFSRLMLRRPHYRCASPFLAHVPFLFWVHDMLRPRHTVHLGDLDPVAYFAACQAQDRLDLDGRCTGIRLSGDIPEEILRHDADIHSDLSRLMTLEAGAAPDPFEDKSIDLLFLDSVPEEETVSALLRAWPRKLSARSVVLLAGTGTDRYARGAPAEFLANIRATYPTFTLDIGAGITAVLYGTARHERLLRLASLSPGVSGFTDAQTVFRRLGDAIQFEWMYRGAETRARQAIETGDRDRAEAETRISDLQAQLTEARAAFKERTAQVAATQARAAAAQETAEALTQDRDRDRQLHRAQAEKAAAALRDAERTHLDQIKALTRKLEQEQERRLKLGEDLAAVKTDRAEAGTRTARLLSTVEETRAALQDAERTLAQERELRRQQAEDLAAMQARCDEAETLTSELLSSTSWKVTGPMRSIVATLRRR